MKRWLVLIWNLKGNPLPRLAINENEVPEVFTSKERAERYMDDLKEPQPFAARTVEFTQ